MADVRPNVSNNFDDSNRIMHWQVLMYPLGLLRITQTIISIIALACATHHWGEFHFQFNCTNTDNNGTHPSNTTYRWSYPFDLSDSRVGSCDPKYDIHTPTFLFFISFKVESEFFVFVAVGSTILSICSILVYITRWVHYEADARYPLLDVVSCAVFTAIWLTAVATWFCAVNIMKMYLSPASVKSAISSLQWCQCNNHCPLIDGYDPSFGNLNFSLVCGAISVILWLITTGVTYRNVRKLKSEHERYQTGSSTIADAFSSSSPSTLR